MTGFAFTGLVGTVDELADGGAWVRLENERLWFADDELAWPVPGSRVPGAGTNVL